MHSAWFERPPAASASAALADRSTPGPAARTARWQARVPAWTKSNVGIVMMRALLKDIEKNSDRVSLVDHVNGPTIPNARASNRVANERNHFLFRKSPAGFLYDHPLKADQSQLRLASGFPCTVKANAESEGPGAREDGTRTHLTLT